MDSFNFEENSVGRFTLLTISGAINLTYFLRIRHESFIADKVASIKYLMKELSQIIAENVRFLRTTKTDLSQMKLAVELDMAPSYLTEIETGKQLPSLHVIERIAAYFNVQPYEILYPKDIACEKACSADHIHSLRHIKEQIDEILDSQIQKEM